MAPRQVYRVRMASWLPVEIKVALDGWPAVRGVLLDASSEGAGLLVPAEMDGMVIKRDDVELTFQMLQSEGSCQVKARIVGDYGIEDGYRRYGVAFSRSAEELAGDLGQIFNRRRHERVAPPKRTAVDVVRPGAPVESLRAGLRDVSASGVALAVPMGSGPVLAKGTSVVLGVTLTGSDGDGRLWRLEGHVRRQSEEGGHHIVGVELEDDSRRLAMEHAVRSWMTAADVPD